MRILVITNLYPTKERPFVSPFVKEQVESIRECFPDLTVDVRIIEGARPRWAYLRETILLPMAVEKGGYDIVHAHYGLTLISTLFVRVPLVITFHGSDVLVSPTKSVSKFLAPTASKVIVVAQNLKESLGYGEIIPCGIDTKKFLLPSNYENKTCPKIPGKLKVLFPSAPARKVKGYELFKAACLELEKRGNKVEEIHLANIEREKVQNLYWECDVMLLTSISEGSPTVIKEAIAAKLPFVSVDVGDVKDWTALIDFGVVVSDRKPKTIADTLTDLLARIKTREALDNRKCIEAFDLANVAQRVKRLYEKTLEKSSQ